MDKQTIIIKILTALSSAILVGWACYDDYLIGGGPGFGFFQLLVFILGLCLALACLAPYKITSGIFAIFASTAITLFIAELLLKTFFSPLFYTAFEINDRYHYKLIPDTSRIYQRAAINGGEKILYRVNSKGFRGEELLSAKPKLRIAVYGDSFIQAEFSDLHNTFTEQLEHKLHKSTGKTIEVINAGIAGYGPDQLVKKLEDELPWLKPDLVIFSIFSGNDFGDLVRNKMFRLDSDRNIFENNFSVEENVRRNMQLARHELMLKKVLQHVLYSFGSKKIEQPQGSTVAIENALQQHLNEYEEYVLQQDNVVKELRSDPYSADISLKPESESARYKIDLMKGILAKAKSLSSTNDVPIIFMIIPHPIDLLNGKHDSGEVDNAKYTDYQPARLSNILEQIAVDQDVDFINLYEPFAESSPSDLYFKGGDDHWNDRGQAYAAELMSKHIFISQTPTSKAF